MIMCWSAGVQHVDNRGCIPLPGSGEHTSLWFRQCIGDAIFNPRLMLHVRDMDAGMFSSEWSTHMTVDELSIAVEKTIRHEAGERSYDSECG